MKTRIVRIGNSRGIRIPKPLLEAAGLVGEVDVTAKRGTLIIRPIHSPRGMGGGISGDESKRG